MQTNRNLAELQSLFDIEQGNKFDLNKMCKCAPGDDAIAFVGRSGKENGIVAFVRRIAGCDPYDPGLITVALGGATLSSFVQPRPFYTGQNIDVLRPCLEMPSDVRLYYCLCIEANRFRYSTYGREANRTLKTLLVPKRRAVPAWVRGVTQKAVDELRDDLGTAIGA